MPTWLIGPAVLLVLTAGTAHGGDRIVISSHVDGEVSNEALAPVGSTIEIDLYVRELGHGAHPSLGSFDLILRWDEDRFDFQGASFGALLGDETLGESITNANEIGVTQFDPFAWATVSQISLLSPIQLKQIQPNIFRIASARFDVLALSPSIGERIGGEFGFGFAPRDSGVTNFVRDAIGEDFESVSLHSALPLPCLEVTGLQCDSDGENVTLSWSNGEFYENGISILRATVEVGTLQGDEESFVDIGVPVGNYSYEVIGRCSADDHASPARCEVAHCDSVEDLPPVFSSVPMDHSQKCCQEFVFTPEATDDCGDVTISCTAWSGTPEIMEFEHLGGDTYSLTLNETGGALVTCTAMDEHGNETVHEFLAGAQCENGIDIQISPEFQDVPTGETATFDITVTANVNGSTVFDISVENPTVPECDRVFNNPLHPGESVTYECSVVATEDFTTLATVHATGHCDSDLTASASAEVVVNTAFMRGDVDSDGGITIADPVVGLSFIFGQGKALGCADAGDSNDDGAVDISDMTLLIGYLFMNEGGPTAPFPNCGTDPNEEEGLECVTYPYCP